MNLVFDMITIGAVGFASVIAFTAFWRGRKEFELRPMVTLLAALSFAGLMQVVKVAVPPTNPPPPTSTAASAPSPTVTPPTTGSKTPKPLFDLTPISLEKYDDSNKEATIDRKSYQHSRGMQLCTNTKRTWQFQIDGGYATFRVHLGLTGTENLSTVVKFEIVGDDDKPLHEPQEVKIGPARQLDVPLKGVRQLKLMTTLMSKKQDPCENLTAQWADAQLIPN